MTPLAVVAIIEQHCIGGVIVARCRCGWESGECSWPSTAAALLANHLDMRESNHGESEK